MRGRLVTWLATALCAGLVVTGAVHAAADDGTTPLHEAVYRDDVASVKKLIGEGADVRAKNAYGATPMSEAAIVGDVEVIKTLLKAGSDVESPGADHQTALMVVARSSNVEA